MCERLDPRGATHPARTASLLLRTASSHCLTRRSRSLGVFRVSPGRLAPALPPHADRSNPVPEDDFHLAQFRFEEFDAEGVFRRWDALVMRPPHDIYHRIFFGGGDASRTSSF